MTTKDQIKLGKLYMESRADDLFYGDSEEDWDSEQNEMTSSWFDEAMTLAKDYYVIQNPKYKQQIKSDINELIHNIQTRGTEDYYTYDFINQIRGVMQHGSSDQDEYNAENASERDRENWASMSAEDRYGDY
jgi:hypothetical protein